MQLSENIISFIKNNENFEQSAKKNQAGVLVIGYGTTMYQNGILVAPGDICDKDMANIWLVSELMECVKKLETLNLKLTDNQFCGILDFVYSEGFDVFKKSLLYRKILANPLDTTIFGFHESLSINSCEFLRFVYIFGKIVPSLVRRRINECIIYNS